VPTPIPPAPEEDDIELSLSPTDVALPLWEPWSDPELVVASLGQEPSAPLFAVALDALQDMIGHGSVETNREVGGILVGRFVQTSRGALTRIDDIIIADSAEASLTHVTFTHDSWSRIHQQLDQRGDGGRIVGWYHTHPGFGPFLSGHDLFIQRNFFSDPRLLALVLDPVQWLVACFGWRDGEIVKTNGVYVFCPREQAEEARGLRERLVYASDGAKCGGNMLSRWFHS
jgi:proteasome lid subunit RPN8/RPN11